MRNHLDGAAQEIAAAFLANDLGVNLPAGEVADPTQANVNEALVVTQVEVCFRAVVQNEDLPMLVGRHGARVNVDVWIELLDCDLEAALFEDEPGCGGGDALANRRYDAAGEEEILCSHRLPHNPIVDLCARRANQDTYRYSASAVSGADFELRV